MVEVFKTNVQDRCDADKLLCIIKENFCHYSVNFDLEDCDKILRVECEESPDLNVLRMLFTNEGYDLQVLPD